MLEELAGCLPAPPPRRFSLGTIRWKEIYPTADISLRDDQRTLVVGGYICQFGRRRGRLLGYGACGGHVSTVRQVVVT